MSSFSFVILAAGRGERLGGVPKQFRRLGSRPVWQWSLELARELRCLGEIDEIAVVFPPEAAEEILQNGEEFSDIIITKGGLTRTLSVKNALLAVHGDAVFLHDGARPFLSWELFMRIKNAFCGDNAVIPLLPEYDALKKQVSNNWDAVDREGLFITQTPQLFPRIPLLSFLEDQISSCKDEAEPWLLHGRKLDVVDGSRENFKITDEGDWLLARKTVQISKTYRTGLGYDIHPLVPGRKLILGGITIVDAPLGLDGHSDADLLCHAVADAILGGAGLPDIGILFPASEERYLNCSSLKLLADAVRIVKKAGWSIDWIDAVVTAQVPRLCKWHQSIIESLEKILGKGRVNLKFKFGEAIPPIGTAAAMIAWVTATVSSGESPDE